MDDEEDSTAIRDVQMTAILVGPHEDATEKVARGLARAKVRVVRVGDVGTACEGLAIAMPQVVLVVGRMRPDERERLADRAKAVGALVVQVDPTLDDEMLDELVGRAATEAIARKMLRDEAPPKSGSDR